MGLIGATGSVLPASANAWVRENVGERVQLGSMSGGTDIGRDLRLQRAHHTVYDGEISEVALGVSLPL